MALKYKIQVKPDKYGEIYIKAVPNEWACTADLSIALEDIFHPERQVPYVKHISWSTGARDWTVEDARTFFKACLAMLDEADRQMILRAGDVKAGGARE